MTKSPVSERIELGLFELLEQVSTEGSLTSAAAALGITQQAASARISRAEQRIGHELVQRHVTGSTLTTHGGMVLEWGRPVLEAARRAAASIETLQYDEAVLIIAASQTVAELLLPQWLGTLRRTEPDIAVRLLSGNSAEVTALVRAGRAAIGFIEAPATPHGLNAIPITTDPLDVAVAPDHPWAQSPHITPQDLATTPLIVREPGSGGRATLEAWLAAYGLTLTTPAAELSTAAAIRAAARSGIAPAVVSSRAITDDLASGKLVRVHLPDKRPTRSIAAIWSHNPLPDTAYALIRTAIGQPTHP